MTYKEVKQIKKKIIDKCNVLLERFGHYFMHTYRLYIAGTELAIYISKSTVQQTRHYGTSIIFTYPRLKNNIVKKII